MNSKYINQETLILQRNFLMTRMKNMWKKTARFSILYYGLRAAAADGELHAKEREAVCKLAKKLNVSDEEVQQIYSLIDEENK